VISVFDAILCDRSVSTCE